MSHSIEVAPYNPKWPEMFEREAKFIRDVLGENCIAVHHVGSTSVPGLAAKPKIDIITVVKNTSTITSKLESVGYDARGEFNIPFHCGFSKREPNISVNLHVYEDGNPEIALNLSFRDYLRTHPDALVEYANLKLDLLRHPSSQEKNGQLYSNYTLGKDDFIKKILMKSGFNALCIRICTHFNELEAAKKLRKRYFPIDDPYSLTFDHKDHVHFIFYQGVEIIGYAHIELLQNQKATFQIFMIDEPYQQRGFESYFLPLCERWLKLHEFTLESPLA